MPAYVSVNKAATILGMGTARMYETPIIRKAMSKVPGKKKGQRMLMTEVETLKNLFKEEETTAGNGDYFTAAQIASMLKIPRKKAASIVKSKGRTFTRGKLATLKDAQDYLGRTYGTAVGHISSTGPNLQAVKNCHPPADLVLAPNLIVQTDANSTVQKVIEDKLDAAEELPMIYERVTRFIQWRLTFNRVVTLGIREIIDQCCLEAKHVGIIIEVLLKYASYSDIRVTLSRGAVK